MRKPDFLIAGAPKCGTTSLHAYLQQHPRVFLPDWKEPHFFGTDLDWTDRERISEAAYGALFDPATADQRCGEASVFYLLSERAAREIRDCNPAARIIAMLRNPIDMIHSFHSQRVYNGTEDVDFGVAMEIESERRSGRKLPPRVGLRQGLYYRELAQYADQLQRYIDTFPREQLHVILFEDFKSNTPESFRNVAEFLGVDPTFSPDFAMQNPNTVARSRFVGDLLGHTPKAVSRIARVVPTSLRLRIRKAMRRANTRSEPRSPMAPELRARLVKEFGDGIRRLEGMLDRDLSAWLTP